MSDRRAKDEGRLRLHRRFASAYLSTPRDIVVYVPPGYDENVDRLPVFYLQDGQNLFDPATAFNGQDWQADLTADNMIRAGAIEPVLMVGVYNAGVRRISEYTPTRDRTRHKGGKGDRYAQMLARELKPFIDTAYRTRKGTPNHVVGGSSLGGLVALEAALLYPRVFGKAAVLSPSVWWDSRSILELVRKYDAASRPRIWLDCGTQEGDDAAQVVEDLRALRGELLAKGWQQGSSLQYCEIDGAGHNEPAWAARFGAVLKWLFSK